MADKADMAGYSWIQLDTAGCSWIKLNTAGYRPGYSGIQLDIIKIYSRVRVSLPLLFLSFKSPHMTLYATTNIQKPTFDSL
jgi:hypothetical protein